MGIDQIKGEIARIEDNESKLYSYLYDLTYKEVSKNIRLLETVYSTFLNDKRSEIKRIAIYCLLFGLQIQKPEYKKVALQNMQNKQNDIDLRLTCITGLAQAYMTTDDIELLSTFYFLFNDIEEDEDIRAECFVAMMKIHGMGSTEILNKNMNKVIISLGDLHLEDFEKQLTEIKRLISDNESQ